MGVSEIKPIEQNQPNMLQILSSVINKEGGKEMLETVAKLYREERDDNRRILFNTAMSLVQKEMQRVTPNAQNPQTHSDYATYDRLDEAVRPIYSKHGFSLTFNTKKSDIPDTIDMTCLVSHDGGWSLEYYIPIPADGKGARGNDVMTKTHAAGSAVSYGMRYLLKMIFNIPIGFDDDGNAAGKRKRQEPPTKMEPPQGVDIQGMRNQIWEYCLAESDGDEDKAQRKLFEISTGWKTVNGKKEKRFEGITDVNDPDFSENRVQYVHSQIFRKQQ